MTELVLFRLSTPQGVVDLGFQFEFRFRASNIVCLPCKEKRQLSTSRTLEEFVGHIKEKHPEVAHFLELRNYDKIIV